MGWTPPETQRRHQMNVRTHSSLDQLEETAINLTRESTRLDILCLGYLW
jgi:hypothetical protein